MKSVFLKPWGFRTGSYHEEAPWYRNAAFSTLEAVAAAGSVLEGNTGGGVRNTSGALYPSPFILREALRLGIPVMVAADAHRPEHFDGTSQEGRHGGAEHDRKLRAPQPDRHAGALFRAGGRPGDLALQQLVAGAAVRRDHPGCYSSPSPPSLRSEDSAASRSFLSWPFRATILRRPAMARGSPISPSSRAA